MAFDHVNRTKLMQIIKGTDIHWHKRRLINKLYTDQSIKVQDQGEASVKTGRGDRQGCCSSPILLNLNSEYLTKEAIKGFGDVKIGQVIRIVKYADGLVLLAMEGTVLQGMIDRLIKI
jgi:hypothetical protein